jgi:hypothetical protein
MTEIDPLHFTDVTRLPFKQNTTTYDKYSAAADQLNTHTASAYTGCQALTLQHSLLSTALPCISSLAARYGLLSQPVLCAFLSVCRRPFSTWTTHAALFSVEALGPCCRSY